MLREAMNVLEAAQQSAQALLKTDPKLESAPLLADRVAEVIQKTLASSMN